MGGIFGPMGVLLVNVIVMRGIYDLSNFWHLIVPVRLWVIITILVYRIAALMS